MNNSIRIRVITTTVALLILRVELVRAQNNENPVKVKPVMVFSGPDSSAEKREFARCTSMRDLKQKWRIHCNLSADDECSTCPVIDFDSYEMVVLFEGKTDPNCGVQIIDVCDTGDRIRIRYKIMYYNIAVPELSELEGVQAVKTKKLLFQPFAFILLRTSKKPIVIEDNLYLTMGAPPSWKKIVELPVAKVK
jgi:hypothetical protein